jgi:hypothetical protein
MELLEAIEPAFFLCPGPNGLQVDVVANADQNRNCQGLLIFPVKERRQSIAAGIGGRQRSDPRPPDRHESGTDSEITSDCQRTGREFDVKAAGRVDVPVTPTLKFNARHDSVQAVAGNIPLDDEIEIDGLIEAGGVDRRTGSAR